MNGINIITRHDVTYNLANVFPRFRISRIKVKLAGIADKEFRIAVIRMHGRKSRRPLGLCPVRIDPGMQLHAALVTFFHHKLERIPHGLRGFSLNTRQKTAPGLVAGTVQGIGLGTHLKDYGIDSGTLQIIELTDQCLLHFLGRHTLELAVHTLYPRSAEFTLGISGLGRQAEGPHPCHQDYK